MREREPEAPIEIVYEDQPGNDWHSVFNRTQGTIATEGIGDATALPGDLDDVHVLASGTSYYSTCVAGDSVDMAFCAGVLNISGDRPCCLKIRVLLLVSSGGTLHFEVSPPVITIPGSARQPCTG